MKSTWYITCDTFGYEANGCQIKAYTAGSAAEQWVESLYKYDNEPIERSKIVELKVSDNEEMLEAKTYEVEILMVPIFLGKEKESY